MVVIMVQLHHYKQYNDDRFYVFTFYRFSIFWEYIFGSEIIIAFDFYCKFISKRAELTKYLTFHIYSLVELPYIFQLSCNYFTSD